MSQTLSKTVSVSVPHCRPTHLDPPLHSRHSSVLPSSQPASQPWQHRPHANCDGKRWCQTCQSEKKKKTQKNPPQFKYRAEAWTDPKDAVGCNNRSLIVDSCNLDVHRLGCALLPQARVVGHHSEAVGQRLAAIVDVVNQVVLHLVEGQGTALGSPSACLSPRQGRSANNSEVKPGRENTDKTESSILIISVA